MNVILENLLEKDIVNCYNEMDYINNKLNSAYISHDEISLRTEELKLINLMKNINRISILREELLN